MFTPFELSILLHYYSCCDLHPQTNCPIWDVTMLRFVELGLMQRTGDPFALANHKLTERGHFYVKHGLCCVPLPIQRWVIPANTEAVTP